MAILVNQSRNKTINHSDAKRLSKLEITVTTCEKKIARPKQFGTLAKNFDRRKNIFDPRKRLKNYDPCKKMF